MHCRQKLLKCAPIIIPTLNRKEHLERCITSLANNVLANQTEIFISVDYPPSSKYETGYQEVLAYLRKNTYLHSAFKKVTIFYQTNNLGPCGNTDFLENKIKVKYDRYIYTEDDNEFSPNFLEYVNKGLEIFENVENIIAVCGCKDTSYISKNNFLASKLFPAYGVGRWVEKDKRMKINISKVLLDKKVYSGKIMDILKKNNRTLYNIYITNVLMGNKMPYWCDGDLRNIDSVISIYLHISDFICIVPLISKSRTWGNDGSGVNMLKTNTNVEENIIDCMTTFDFDKVDDNIEFNDLNYGIGNEYMEKCNSKKFNLKADIFYIVLKLCKYNRIMAKKIVMRIFGV